MNYTAFPKVIDNPSFPKLSNSQKMEIKLYSNKFTLGKKKLPTRPVEVQKIKMIRDKEEIEYIFERYMKMKETQIVNILNTYYNLVESEKSPNPEDHFSYIAKKCTVSVDFVKEVFDIQLDFLVSKGIAG